MSARKSSHGTIFVIVSSGSPLALIASSLRSTSKKPFCPKTRSLHPPISACGHRIRFVGTREKNFSRCPWDFSRFSMACSTAPTANANPAAAAECRPLRWRSKSSGGLGNILGGGQHANPGTTDRPASLFPAICESAVGTIKSRVHRARTRLAELLSIDSADRFGPDHTRRAILTAGRRG
jgi:hypothetical protein